MVSVKITVVNSAVKKYPFTFNYMYLLISPIRYAEISYFGSIARREISLYTISCIVVCLSCAELLSYQSPNIVSIRGAAVH